ncbi:MAG: glycosyltransferase family 9 protein [Bacteroidia bacterium]|nr:glycosyltransferase family 9 protein [Bacteroidia bacterium]
MCVPKFLILRFSSIGDIVLTSPVVRCLKEQVPGAEVHFLTKRAFAPVLQHNPFLDKLHLLGERDEVPWTAMRAERFDAVIDLHHNLRSLRVKRVLGVKSHSFRKLNVEKWLRVNLKIDRLPRIHIVDRYLETVSAYGVRNDGRGLDYFITPDEEAEGLAVLPPSHRGGYIGLVIGAKHATKRLPDRNLVTLCGMLKQPVVLLGGPEDKELGEFLRHRAGELVFNACGKTGLNASASLVKHARAIITHDTGLMHIAAAYGKKIVSIWGNTIPEFGMAPYPKSPDAPPSFISEVHNLSCRPCSKIGYGKCPIGHFRGMRDQNLFSIVENVW